MRFVLAAAAFVLPLALTGCRSGTTPAATPSVTATQTPWVIYNSGNPTPSRGAARFTGTPPPALPSVSYLSTSSACTMAWPETGLVLIPMVITPVAGGFKVEWPSAYGSYYRITAVRQGLVKGPQPEPSWTTVPAGAGCTVSTTLTGLTSGAPYIIWLDAPDTPRARDGGRSLYSGKSGVVKPL
ncbi:hypothetical protein ACQP2F_02045 [Actinoplanes sp. CA-030573]|uniref:hypothetical protein n=1 Tax=Actinoplanes sp. CA-030573 TaxID=3239898 RepID=UPI003D91C920